MRWMWIDRVVSFEPRSTVPCALKTTEPSSRTLSSVTSTFRLSPGRTKLP